MNGDALVEGRSYTVNILASQTVSFTGTLENGVVTMSGLTRGTNAASSWQLLGNPFARAPKRTPWCSWTC